MSKQRLTAVGIAAVMMLTLSVSAQAAESCDALAAILKDVRHEWWRSGWDKHAELKAFIEKYGSDKVSCATAQFYIGANHYADKNYERAVTEFGKVITDYPGAAECAQAQYEMGFAYERLKSWDDAMWAYNEVVSEYGECKWAAKALFRLGLIHQRNREYELANEAYGRIVSEHPATPEAPQALIKTGYCHRMLKQPEAELAAYERVVSEYGESKHAATARLKIGMIHRKARRFDAELDEYQAVAEEYAESETGRRAKLKVGEHHARAGRHVEAVATWEELADDTMTASAPVASLKIAQAYGEMGEGEYAIKTYRRMTRDYPGSDHAARAHVEMGRQYRQTGERDAALQCFNKVVSDCGKHRRPVIEARVELGDMALTGGDASSALEQYHAAYRVPYVNLTLQKKMIERIARMMEALDGSAYRARQFLEYQLYGPTGRDGEPATGDDLSDPLCDGYSSNEAETSAALYAMRTQKMSERDRARLRDFLLRSLGREYEVESGEASKLSALEAVMGGSGDLTGKLAALREYSKIKRNQKTPVSKLAEEGSVAGELDARMRRYGQIAEWCRRIYADHVSEDTRSHEIVMIEAEARQLRAAAYRAQGELNLAIYEYESLDGLSVPSPMKAFFKYELGKLNLQTGNEDDAVMWFERLSVEHADQPNAAAAAQYELAKYYGRQDDQELLEKTLREVAGNYPQTAWAARAQRELDWLSGLAAPDEGEGMPFEVHYVKDDLSAYAGKKVEFSSSWGEFSPAVVETDANGCAKTRFNMGDRKGEVTIRIEMETGDVIIENLYVANPAKLRSGL